MARNEGRVLEGFLHKRGNTNTLSWKRRWFVVYASGKMYYFKVSPG
jgi:hypothetical protein